MIEIHPETVKNCRSSSMFVPSDAGVVLSMDINGLGPEMVDYLIKSFKAHTGLDKVMAVPNSHVVIQELDPNQDLVVYIVFPEDSTQEVQDQMVESFKERFARVCSPNQHVFVLPLGSFETKFMLSNVQKAMDEGCDRQELLRRALEGHQVSFYECMVLTEYLDMDYTLKRKGGHYTGITYGCCWVRDMDFNPKAEHADKTQVLLSLIRQTHKYCLEMKNA